MNFADASDSPCWYAIHTKPKQEDRAESNLRAWRVETFAPQIKERRFSQFTGETFLTKPLFPRYIFARFKASSLLHKVTYTRGVNNVVNFGGEPMQVDDEIIEIVRSRVGQDGYIRIGDEFKAGDRVRVENGPFKDFQGVFERNVKESDRVMIMLTTVKYQGHISVPRELIRKIEQPSCQLSY